MTNTPWPPVYCWLLVIVIGIAEIAGMFWVSDIFSDSVGWQTLAVLGVTAHGAALVLRGVGRLFTQWTRNLQSVSHSLQT